MALVQCPECGGQVSSHAPACPHCGYAPSAAPPAHQPHPGAPPVIIHQQPRAQQQARSSVAAGFGGCLGVVLAVIFMAVLFGVCVSAAGK